MTHSTSQFEEIQLERGGIAQAIWLRGQALAARFPAASQGLLSIFDQALVSGTSFITAAIIGRTTSPDQLGMYYLLLSVVLILTGIQDNVISAPYLVHAKRRQGGELAEYGGSVWLHLLLMSATTVVALLIAIAATSASGQMKAAAGLWALVGAAPLLLLRQGIRRFSFATLHVRSAIALDAVVAIIQLGGLFLAGRSGHLSLFVIYAIMGGACGVSGVGWYLLDRPQLRFVRERFLSDWRHNWAFGKWTLRSYLIGNTTPQVMLWMLGLTAGEAAAGTLGACSTLVGMTYVLLNGVDNVLTPQAVGALHHGGAKNLRRFLLCAGAFLALTMGSFCLLALLTGDWLVVLVFGAHYQGTGAILSMLGFSALATSIGIVAGNGLWALEHPRANFIADVACLIVTLIAAAILIPLYAAWGAAAATLAGTAAAAVVRCLTLARFLEELESESQFSTGAALTSSCS
ncbi:MAG: lipopolysaccharide biosynthesis protein [Pirellulales bacterium]